jgi:YD repeat-containing protein
MKNTLLIAALSLSISVDAQYYYNDLPGTQEINDKMKAFLAAKVQSCNATGYDPKGVESTDFNEWQEIQNNGSLLKVISRNGEIFSTIYYQFDNKARLISTRDSSGPAQNITSYTYDAGGNLVSIKTSLNDSPDSLNETEVHQWQYTATGKPKRMLRILNGTDTSEYRFTLDEHGNIADETRYRKGIGADSVYYIYENQRVYYYYDDHNRVTDIVRYNKKAKRLLPDIILEYDANNRIIRRTTTVSSTTPDYFVWEYVYDAKGLKTKEILRNKFKELKGRIEYAYNF